jgi:hydroxyacyl-ACP dehydratase HTD2-like protein with hotdog domain
VSTRRAIPDGDNDETISRQLASSLFTPTEVDLFMFCASTWNTHRIHYDRDYARSEGHQDLVVPGPLQAARLAQLLSEYAQAKGGRLHRMSVRHQLTVYCNEPLELRAVLSGSEQRHSCTAIEVLVFVLDATGREATTGNATILFEGAGLNPPVTLSGGAE